MKDAKDSPAYPATDFVVPLRRVTNTSAIASNNLPAFIDPFIGIGQVKVYLLFFGLIPVLPGVLSDERGPTFDPRVAII